MTDTTTRPSEAAMRAAKALMKKWTGIMLEAQHELEALAADDPFGPSLSDMQDGDDLAQDRIARIIDAHTREVLDEVLGALNRMTLEKIPYTMDPDSEQARSYIQRNEGIQRAGLYWEARAILAKYRKEQSNG